MKKKHRPCAFVTAALTLVLITASSLASRPLAQDTPASTGSSVMDGVFTSSQAARGRQQFQQTCTSCHSMGEHTGQKFGVKWQGTTIGDLFDLVSSTMPEGDPGSLKPEEYASILAFFLSESGYKDGEKELPSDLESLKKIRIEPLPK
jgi:polar amino acid transport system substrate-binding protein